MPPLPWLLRPPLPLVAVTPCYRRQRLGMLGVLAEVEVEVEVEEEVIADTDDKLVCLGAAYWRAEADVVADVETRVARGALERLRCSRVGGVGVGVVGVLSEKEEVVEAILDNSTGDLVVAVEAAIIGTTT
eukprot:TRINITY_DN1314_c0_g1_i13.p2 TRINITY_DN1314_c0_g1~~TRINITY_DN1314_c0_g1_i13.p2  ORF type:complete len:131 (-),score=22.99 TRINITY_DN1314_c0_g1_i13:351-743(-)